MEALLSYRDTVQLMFQLGILTALWGVYGELKRMREQHDKRD